MMIRLLMLGMLAIPGVASALQPLTPPGLLPTGAARPLLEQDPAVAAAREGLEVARQDARLLDQSPHEWVARSSGQQRRVDGGNRYTEWSVGVERAIRLPGKAEADRRLGAATVEESKARYGEALHESARELMALWVDWLAAERAHEITQGSLQSTEASLSAVEKRVRAGDASKLDLSLARAELSEQARQDTEARTAAHAAWARLSTRFPGVTRQPTALPAPAPLEGEAAAWRTRILEQSDEFKTAQLQIQKAQALADRARADTLPDPTLGGYTASEIGGRERIYGVTISVPIPGSARSARHARAVAAVDMARREVDLKQRELETSIASAWETAGGTYASLQRAREGAAFMQENAALMQRAYELGEADLQAMLLARRQANTATSGALQTQASALKAYYGLLVDAHLIWEMDHD